MLTTYPVDYRYVIRRHFAGALTRDGIDRLCRDSAAQLAGLDEGAIIALVERHLARPEVARLYGLDYAITPTEASRR
jgi:hypothetical protein